MKESVMQKPWDKERDDFAFELRSQRVCPSVSRGATEADITIADLNGDGLVNKDDVEEIVKIIFANKK